MAIRWRVIASFTRLSRSRPNNTNRRMSSKVKIIAPLAIGLFIGYLYKGMSGDLKQGTTKEYDFKAEASQSMNQAFGIKKK